MGGGGLDRLTHRERRVLRLLASGHSIKSAAAEEGISENAASELLRSARRKLGTGSSREAARLLAAHEGEPQKIRDEKSVLPVSATDRRSGAGFSKGSAAMIVTALAATAAIALIVQSGDSPNPSVADESQGGQAVTEEAPAGDEVATPRVVRTVPADGAEIDAGRFTVEVTFDRPMLAQAYSFVRSDEGLYPECPSPPRLSADGRTYSLECVARQPGPYVMYFNRPPYMNFREADTQTSAEPARLAFTVRGG